MLSKQNQRPTRPPHARNLFGGEAEAALRGWLTAQITLSDRRIVEYHEHRGRSTIMKYRELDAVSILNPQTIHVFEIKASHRAGSLRRASQQLRDTRTILGMLFNQVHTTIMLVDTGIPTAEEVTQIMRGDDAPAYAPLTLADVLEHLPNIRSVASLDERDPDPEITNLLHFSIDDIISLAGIENLHLDWDDEDADDESSEEQPATEAPQFAYTTAPEVEDDDDNPLAAALRRAMQRDGGSK